MIYEAPMLRPGEVADALGCSRQNITKLIRSGNLGALNISASARPRWRIPREELHRFVDERSAPVTPGRR